MMPEERWELLERIGTYAAGELEGEEAREVERLITENEDHQQLAQYYTRMFVLLSVIGEEAPEAPEAIVNQAVRRALVSAFLRQAENALGDLGWSYLGALAQYLGLRVREV